MILLTVGAGAGAGRKSGGLTGGSNLYCVVRVQMQLKLLGIGRRNTLTTLNNAFTFSKLNSTPN